MSDASNRPAVPRISLVGLTTCPRCRSFVRSHRAGSEAICPFCDAAPDLASHATAVAAYRNPITSRMLSALGVTALATALGGCPDVAHDDEAAGPQRAVTAPDLPAQGAPGPSGDGSNARAPAVAPDGSGQGDGADLEGSADEAAADPVALDAVADQLAPSDDSPQATEPTDEVPQATAPTVDEPQAPSPAPDPPTPSDTVADQIATQGDDSDFAERIAAVDEGESAATALAISAYGLPPDLRDDPIPPSEAAASVRLGLIRCDATDAHGSSVDIEPDIARLQRTIQRWYEREWQAGRAPEGRTRVVVSFSIDENGRVFDEEVDGRGLGGSFAGATSSDIRRWRFSPPDAAPVRATAEIDLTFGGG